LYSRKCDKWLICRDSSIPSCKYKFTQMNKYTFTRIYVLISSDSSILSCSHAVRERERESIRGRAHTNCRTCSESRGNCPRPETTSCHAGPDYGLRGLGVRGPQDALQLPDLGVAGHRSGWLVGRSVANERVKRKVGLEGLHTHVRLSKRRLAYGCAE